VHVESCFFFFFLYVEKLKNKKIAHGITVVTELDVDDCSRNCKVACSMLTCDCLSSCEHMIGVKKDLETVLKLILVCSVLFKKYNFVFKCCMGHHTHVGYMLSLSIIPHYICRR